MPLSVRSLWHFSICYQKLCRSFDFFLGFNTPQFYCDDNSQERLKIHGKRKLSFSSTEKK